MRIVLVDDEEGIRASVRLLIERRTTFEVVGEAADGLAAIELVERLQPDVVVMDVQLPVLGGVEATLKIKERWPHIYVLAFTADESACGDMLAAGASGYLLKGGGPDRIIYSLGTARTSTERRLLQP